MKYFYTDPLAAAWMAANHGMVFQPFTINFFHSDEGNRLLVTAYEKFYIHAGSLHLLDLRHEDIVILRNDIGAWGVFLNEMPEDAKIVSRNGIPFHWPEIEP